jgi:hypothetical protein
MIHTILLSGASNTNLKTALLILLGIVAFIALLPLIYQILRALLIGMVLPALLMFIAMGPIILGLFGLQSDWSLFLSIPALAVGTVLSGVLVKMLFEWYVDFLDDQS